MAENETSLPPIDPAENKPEKRVNFAAEVNSIERISRGKKGLVPKVHSLREARNLRGLLGDQSEIRMHIEGMQEVMVEDEQVKELLTSGQVLLKGVGEPKAPYKKGTRIILNPDILEPIEVIIADVTRHKKFQPDLLVKIPPKPEAEGERAK